MQTMAIMQRLAVRTVHIAIEEIVIVAIMRHLVVRIVVIVVGMIILLHSLRAVIRLPRQEVVLRQRRLRVVILLLPLLPVLQHQLVVVDIEDNFKTIN
jgi:hypothetical protein